MLTNRRTDLGFDRTKKSGFFARLCLNPYEATVNVRVKEIVKHLVGFVILVSVEWCFAGPASVDFDKNIYDVNVPAMNAADALNELAFQTGSVLLFPYQEAKTRQANGVVGEYTLKQAITILLKNSGLVSSLTKEGAIRISVFGRQRLKKSEGKMMNFKKSILALAVSGFGAGGVFGQDDVSVEEGVDWLLEEIVVTATKRESRLQDTAISISALGRDSIDKRNLIGMGDYLNSITGAIVLDQGPGFNSVVIRGLSADPQNEGAESSPSSGIYFGEVSISGLGAFGNSTDIKLVDMERIEVLKGPQGTLYGAGAMGGVVRNIPTAPNLEKIEGEFQLGYSNTTENGSNNSVLKSIINIPLIEDALAIRAVAYKFDESGAYKNIAASDPITSAAVNTTSAVVVNKNDIGSNTFKGGRLSALWVPTDKLTINVSYLTQEIEQEGWGQADIYLGDSWSQQRFQVRDSNNSIVDEGFDDDVEIANLTIEYDLGWATLFFINSLG